MNTKKLEAYIADRIVKIQKTLDDTHLSHIHTEMETRMDEVLVLSAWLEVSESEDTHEDRGGIEL